jgi:DNA-binding transcriptional regulator YdaS (Cro superfamily)
MVASPANPLKVWLKSNRVQAFQFARSLGVPQNTVSRWCIGIRHPRPSAQEKIREATHGAVTPQDWHAYAIGLQVGRAAEAAE